jgi:hypothetical protein
LPEHSALIFAFVLERDERLAASFLVTSSRRHSRRSVPVLSMHGFMADLEDEDRDEDETDDADVDDEEDERDDDDELDDSSANAGTEAANRLSPTRAAAALCIIENRGNGQRPRQCSTSGAPQECLLLFIDVRHALFALDMADHFRQHRGDGEDG